ncbi:MAG: SRPBCC family protein [Candidatus Hydrogenedentes bacterium]|nr:SRPBCC family protein [Candidatus Hydrogenedentota bacterium]
MQVAVSIEIDRPREEVFRALADFPRHTDWNYGLESSEVLDATEGLVGTRLKQAYGESLRLLTFTGEVTACVPPERIEIAWKSRSIDVEDVYLLAGTETGTLLEQRSEWHLKSWFALMMRAFFEEEHRHRQHNDLKKLKALLETEDS